MNTGRTKSTLLFLALLLVAFVAGCGGNNSNPAALSSDKAITAYSIDGVHRNDQ